MLSRFVIAVLFVGVLPVVTHSQENNEVVLGSIKDQLSLAACGPDGRTYFWRQNRDPSTGAMSGPALLAVSRDGSMATFELPIGALVTAVDDSGLRVLGALPHRLHEDWRFEMYELDSQGSQLGHYSAAIDFFPRQMAVLPSRKTVVVGHTGDVSYSHRDQWTYVGAVLDTVGRVVTKFEFPSPAGGGKWMVESREKMAVEDGAAYLVLESDSDTGIAKISEAGHVDVKIIADPVDDDEHPHHLWLLGPGVAVEEYGYLGDRPRFKMHYDEYDLKSGEKIATKVSSGGSAQCYFGTEVSWTVGSGNVDPSRHLSPDTLRLVFTKLERAEVPAPATSH